MRAALADGPRTVKELGELGAGFVGDLGPVGGPRPGAAVRDVGAASGGSARPGEAWVGPPDATEDEGLAHLVRAYLRAFGPAPWRDIGLWAGISATDAKRGGEGLELVTYRDEAGKALVDLPDAPLPDPGTPAPVRFLPHWDAFLLVHARRTGVLPEAYRPRIFTSKNPFSVGTVPRRRSGRRRPGPSGRGGWSSTHTSRSRDGMRRLSRTNAPPSRHSSADGSGRSGGPLDLLDRPAVAVWIGEEDEPAPREVLDLAGVDAPAGKLVAGGDDVGDHELHPDDGAGCRIGDPGPDRDRTGRARRRELDEPELVGHDVVVIGMKPACSV